MQEQIRLLRKGLEDVQNQIARLPQLPQLPQLVQPFSRLLPLATPTRSSLKVHRADHGVSHLRHASSVEKRGTSPPNA